jgi:hypothetical protein
MACRYCSKQPWSEVMRLIFLICLLLTSCAFGKKADWDELKTTPNYKAERETYMQRIGGKEICWQTGLHMFLTKSDLAPSDKCLYFNTNPVKAENGKLGFLDSQLQVVMVNDKGFILETRLKNEISEYKTNKLIFVEATDEKNLVDGSPYPKTDLWQLYEFVGTAKEGGATMYAFKKYPMDKLRGASKGLTYYNPDKEIKNELGIFD